MATQLSEVKFSYRRYEGFYYAVLGYLRFFCGDGAITPPEHRVMHDKLGDLRSQNKGMLILMPTTCRQVLHSPFN
jgi:hypothetical protein